MKHDIFYTPREQYVGMPHVAMCGDFMPYYWQKEFYLYFLKDECVYLTRTKDFVSFSEARMVIERGGDEDQEWHVGTGSVCRMGEKFYFYYTGFRNPNTISSERHEQVIMRAISKDLLNWEKDSSFFMVPDQEHCADGHWRDPDVSWNEEMGKYVMLVTATEKEGADYRRGCTVIYVSDDCDHWKFYKITYAPHIFITHECNNAFKMGDKWYLIFSCFNNWWETRYRYADSLEGPWTEPANDDMFDGRQFYAAKTVSDGIHRYLVGWQSVKRDCDDAAKCIWGGTLLAHELVQKENGELEVKPLETVVNAYREKVELIPQKVQGDWRIENAIIGEEQQGFGWCELGGLKSECMFETDVIWEEGTRYVGIMLHTEDRKLSKWCQLRLECCRNRIVLDRFNRRDGDQSYIEERPVDFKDHKAHIQVFMSGNIIVSYVNGTARASRCYSTGIGSIGVFVENGKCQYENYRLVEKSN